MTKKGNVAQVEFYNIDDALVVLFGQTQCKVDGSSRALEGFTFFQ